MFLEPKLMSAVITEATFAKNNRTRHISPKIYSKVIAASRENLMTIIFVYYA